MTTLTSYLTVEQAVRRGISRSRLSRAIESGTIDAININGDLAVPEVDIETLTISLDQNLIGVPIRVTEAAKKYGVSQPNLSRWADAGYIRIIEQRYAHLELDEADVKRAAAIFKAAREKTGSSVKAGWALKRAMEE